MQPHARPPARPAVRARRHDAGPGLDERWTPAPGKHNELALHLDPLDRDSTAELVRALFCGEADDETVEFLLERSGGNPFFVEELVAFVQETRDSDRLHELPATLHGLVAARLDALEPPERSLLEDCAIVGGERSDRGRPRARGPARRAAGLLDSLAERDFLAIEHDEFHFKSELIREIAYGTLTKAERARRHAVVAPVLAAQRRTGDRPGRAPSRDRGRARRRARRASTASRRRPRAGHRHADARRPNATSRSRSWLAGRTPSRPRARAARRREHRRAAHRAPGPGPRPYAPPRPRRRARRRADRARRGARASATAHARPIALTLLGEGEAATGAYDVAEATFGEALALWRELDDESGAANVLRGLGMTHLFRGDLDQAERFVSEALGSFRSSANQRGAAWALQNLAWISFSHGNIPRAENRLEESADLFGELGDWGGLSWAYGLLAFVRYNQGRLDEAAAIAEHISIEGRETGNRWAVGMMDVLLANVALWSGRTRECVERGTDAIELFQEIGDRWGEVMSTASVVRAHAELGHDDEYASALARYYEVARTMPDEGMHSFPAIVEASVQLQRGNAAEAAATRSRRSRSATRTTSARADAAAAIGLARLQLGDVDGAIDALEQPYAAATDDGPKLGVGCRLALAVRGRAPLRGRPPRSSQELNERARRHVLRPDDRAVGREPRARADRERRRSGQRRRRARDRDRNRRPARTRDRRAGARARVSKRSADDEAASRARRRRAPARRRLQISGDGWRRVFELALDGVQQGVGPR